MDGFVNLYTVFNNRNERSIDFLSSIYNDIEALKENILKVSTGIIDNHELIYNKNILLKPNWVLHNRKKQDSISLCTHPNLILAVIEIIIKNRPAKITVGDAPVQSCNWDCLLDDYFYQRIIEISSKYSIPIEIKDFRRVTFDPGTNIFIQDRNPLSEYLIFDLGKKSELEPISYNKTGFRVTGYNPDRLAESHRGGIHKYCITKALFEADIVISMPKVKTHQKTGITCALKNLVGINGDKDYLPHHRFGGTGFGGDCYPGKNYFRLWAEYALDSSNRNKGKPSYHLWYYLAVILWKLTLPQKVHDLAAAWHGNDTTWRMVMDLNKIAIYGKSDGTISDTKQRTLFSLCDGIIGGQGDGPLNPEPLPLGVISFTDNSRLNDECMATLMQFDVNKLLILKSTSENQTEDNLHIVLNGNRILLKELQALSISTNAPPGWVEHLKR